MIEPEAAYRKPNSFDDKLSEVKRKIAHLNIKAQSMSKAMHAGGAQQTNSTMFYQDDR
jgi:hypothetical protein